MRRRSLHVTESSKPFGQSWIDPAGLGLAAAESGTQRSRVRKYRLEEKCKRRIVRRRPRAEVEFARIGL